jgi:hypothetical protein
MAMALARKQLAQHEANRQQTGNAGSSARREHLENHGETPVESNIKNESWTEATLQSLPSSLQ